MRTKDCCDELFFVLKISHSSFSRSKQLRLSSLAVGGVKRILEFRREESFRERLNLQSTCRELCGFRSRWCILFSFRFICVLQNRSLVLEVLVRPCTRLHSAAGMKRRKGGGPADFVGLDSDTSIPLGGGTPFSSTGFFQNTDR